MPLVKRAVEPVFISRSVLDKGIKNELEGVVVNSLAGVIKQLSSISKHAENLFGELFNDANAIYERTAMLSQRVVVIHQQVTGLDAAMKEDGKSGISLPLCLYNLLWLVIGRPDKEDVTTRGV